MAPARAFSDRQKREATKTEGLLTLVEPTRLMILGIGGSEVTITTVEDFTQKVAVGIQATAWYYQADGGQNILRSLEYPPEVFFSPSDDIRKRVRKVIILPNSQVPDAEGLYDAIAEYLRSSLQWYVAPAALADEIRRRGAKASSTLDFLDPSTGQFDFSRYARGQTGLIPRIASETRVNAVLEVDVEQVRAKVRRMVARWDSVEEPVAGHGMRTLAKFSFFPEKGDVPAATVDLKLWDARGKLLWTNRRGLALLAVLQGSRNKLRERPLSEFLSNGTNVQNWLATVFRSLLPPPEGPAGEQ